MEFRKAARFAAEQESQIGEQSHTPGRRIAALHPKLNHIASRIRPGAYRPSVGKPRAGKVHQALLKLVEQINRQFDAVPIAQHVEEVVVDGVAHVVLGDLVRPDIDDMVRLDDRDHVGRAGATRPPGNRVRGRRAERRCKGARTIRFFPDGARSSGVFGAQARIVEAG